MQPQYELCADGYAKGYPNDSTMMRTMNRTAHGLTRYLDSIGQGDIGRIVLKAYSDTGCPPLKSYESFVKPFVKAGVKGEKIIVQPIGEGALTGMDFDVIDIE